VNSKIFRRNSYTGPQYYWSFGIVSKLDRKGMKLKIELVDENNIIIKPIITGECLWVWRETKINGWKNAGCNDNTFRAESLGDYDYTNYIEDYNGFRAGQKIKINFYEKNYTTPTRSKIVTFN
jgi:hypothetical protein